MVQKETYWKSEEGHKIFASVWQPETGIVAVVILVHGFGEHCLRYAPYVTQFVNENIAFVAYDLFGHGQSEGKRGTIVSYNLLLDDIELALKQTALLFPGKVVFLYGHSMGGNLALNYLLRRNQMLSGGIIASPWLTLTKEPNFILKGLVSLLNNLLPDTTIESGLELKYLSTIKEEVEKYRTDPLNHGRISFRLLYDITQTGIWAMKNTSKLSVPVLMMHGTGDKITSPQSTEIAAKGNPKMIAWMPWEDRYHELHNEPIRNEVASKVIQWIKGRL